MKNLLYVDKNRAHSTLGRRKRAKYIEISWIKDELLHLSVRLARTNVYLKESSFIKINVSRL